MKAAEQRWEDELAYRMKPELLHSAERFDHEQLLALVREAYDRSMYSDDDPQAQSCESGQKSYVEFVDVQKTNYGEYVDCLATANRNLYAIL